MWAQSDHQKGGNTSIMSSKVKLLLSLIIASMAAMLPAVTRSTPDCYVSVNSACWVTTGGGVYQGSSACPNYISTPAKNFCKQICTGPPNNDPGCCTYTTQTVNFASDPSTCPCAGNGAIYTIAAANYPTLYCYDTNNNKVNCPTPANNGTCSP